MKPAEPPRWLMLIPRGQLLFILWTTYVFWPALALWAALNHEWLTLGLTVLMVRPVREIRAAVRRQAGQPTPTPTTRT